MNSKFLRARSIVIVFTPTKFSFFSRAPSLNTNAVRMWLTNDIQAVLHSIDERVTHSSHIHLQEGHIPSFQTAKSLSTFLKEYHLFQKELKSDQRTFRIVFSNG